MENATTAYPDFNHATNANALASGGMAALIIDIGVDKMDREDAWRYLDNLGQAIETLRSKNIPVIWVGMKDRNHLYKPQTHEGSSSPLRDTSELTDAGILPRPEEGGANADLYREFIEKYGPKTNEALYSKFFKSALVEPEDYVGRSGLQSVLQDDYREPIDLPRAGDFIGHSLPDYLRNTHHLILMGAVDTHCIVETAASATTKCGKNVSIASDQVVGWQGDEREKGYKYSRMVWREPGMTEDDSNAWHHAKMRARLTEITKDDRRGLSREDINSIEKVKISDLSNILEFVPLSRLQQSPSFKEGTDFNF